MEKMKVAEEMANLNLSSEGEDLEKSTRLRIQGNELYKAGKLEKAIKAYKKAAIAAPRDSVPLSNLSAAYFESRQYRNCVDVSEQAIAIARKAGDETAVVKKLFPRMMKSLVNSLDWESARKCWTEHNQSLLPAVSSHFDNTLQQAEKCWEVWGSEKDAKKKVLGTLPIYRQSICSNQLTYFHSGDDDTVPIFDKELAGSPEMTKNLCFIGIGDGRHLFATLIGIAKHEKSAAKHSSYHITVDDIHPCVIARLLVFFQIFDDMASAKARGLLGEEKAMFLTTIYYIFAAVAMPTCIFERMYATICKVIDLLEKGKTITGMDMKSCTMSVLRALQLWRGEAPTISASELLEKHGTSNSTSPLRPFCVVKGAEKEWNLFLKTGALVAPQLLQNEEKILRDLMKKIANVPNTATVKAIKSHLTTWKPNVTILDLDQSDYDVKRSHGLNHSPFELARQLYNFTCQDENWIVLKKPKVTTRHFYDHVAPFFDAVSQAWMELQGKLKIEILLADAIDLLEGFQHDIIEGRPVEYPRRFDRIHMSNVPDYIGGSLTVFLFGAKILRPSNGHYITSIKLNSGCFLVPRRSFYNEEMVISDDDTLSKLMGVRFIGTVLPQIPPAPGSQYHIWQRSSFEPLPFSSIYSRPALSTWMFALFFKMAVPVDQNGKFPLIFHSINISIIFRVLSHLYEMGYPGHWLSEILTDILENNVITSARPPRTSPLEIAESTAKNAVKKVSTAPYLVEMRCLSTLFARILPFAISTIIPNPETIHRYSIRIPLFQPIPPRVQEPQNTLVFHRQWLMDKLGFLLEGDTELGPDDQFGYTDPLEHVLRCPFDTMPEFPGVPLEDFQNLYEEGLVIISTFEYDTKNNIASFWMSSEDAANVFGKSIDWKASIWGFMFWRRYTPRILVRGNLKKGEKWFA